MDKAQRGEATSQVFLGFLVGFSLILYVFVSFTMN